MKKYSFVLLSVLVTINYPILSQNLPKETVIFESTIKILQNAKRGGISGGNVYVDRAPLREVVAHLKTYPRSRTIEIGNSESYFLKDSNTMIEVRMLTNFPRRVAGLMLNQLQLRFNFILDTIKIDTLAWCISSPTQMVDTILPPIIIDGLGSVSIEEFCGFHKEIIIYDKKVNKNIQIHAENYDLDVVFSSLRERYGLEIVKKKCTVEFLALRYLKVKEFAENNFFNIRD